MKKKKKRSYKKNPPTIRRRLALSNEIIFSRVMVNIVVIDWTNKHTNRKNKFLFVKFYDEFLWLVRPCVKWCLPEIENNRKF